MFTGLIEGVGTLLRMDRHGPDAQMVIRPHYSPEGITLGESIAVDGACLTVVSFQDGVFAADVSAETLSRTTLGDKKPGAMLNLERALRVGDRLGGHFVSGHVDGVGVLREKRPEGRSSRLYFGMPQALSRYMIEKGSVAVNGISLTVNGCKADSFDVNIVPHTGQETTVTRLRIGEPVNIETDLIGKYVEKMMRSRAQPNESAPKPGGFDEEFLKKHGFL